MYGMLSARGWGAVFGAAVAYVFVKRARSQQWRLGPSDRAESQHDGPSGSIVEPLPNTDTAVLALASLEDVRAAAQSFVSQGSSVGQLSDLLARSFVPTPASSNTTTKPSTLRFLQFNMLARGLSSGPRFGGFTKTPRACLDFHRYRKFRILEEILRYAPDVVAVEECDHFHDFLGPAMDRFGYDGVYQPKRQSPGLEVWRVKMSDKDRAGTQPFFSDGCAVFWKRSKLRGVASGAVGYQSGKQGVLWGQVGLYVRLAVRNEGGSRGLGVWPKSGGSNDRTFVVAATHLKSKASPENEARARPNQPAPGSPRGGAARRDRACCRHGRFQHGS